MKKILVAIVSAMVLCGCLFVAGCGGSEETASSAGAPLDEGVYTVDFESDNPSMIHVNEACDGKATLTVEGDTMTLHLVMPSKNIVNMYAGLSDDAKKDGAELIEPTVEEVTYDDGYVEEVNAFDVPVSVIDEEFDLAIIGKKGKWYDHKCTISNAEPKAD